MKMKNITEMDLHEAISYLEKQHNCVIYGLLDTQSLEEDIDSCVLKSNRNLNKVSRQEWKDAMEYATDRNADANMQEYAYMVDLVAEYLNDNHKANPMNTLGGYSG
tara:strand:+ start:297 stop:614 length:318 start_codon:yes stop_codon:yes gene_type:complete